MPHTIGVNQVFPGVGGEAGPGPVCQLPRSREAAGKGFIHIEGDDLDRT